MEASEKAREKARETGSVPASTASEAPLPPAGPPVKKWGRIDADDERNLPRLASVSDDGLRPDARDKRRRLDSPSDEYYPPAEYIDWRAGSRRASLDPQDLCTTGWCSRRSSVVAFVLLTGRRSQSCPSPNAPSRPSRPRFSAASSSTCFPPT